MSLILFLLGLNGTIRVAASFGVPITLGVRLCAPPHHLGQHPSHARRRLKMVASTSSSLSLEGSHEEGSVGMVFLYSPSSLRHLNYFDKKLALRPVFNSSIDNLADGRENSIIALKPSDLSSGGSFLDDISSLIAGAVFGRGDGKKNTGGERSKATGEVQIQIADEAEAAKFAIDRPARLRAILDALDSSGATVLAAPDHGERDTSRALRLLRRAHTQRYIDELRAKAASIDEGEIRPLSPRSARTYIDRHSFDDAVDAVSDWIDAVDQVLGERREREGRSDDGDEHAPAPVVVGGPAFALVRPPSHHACPTRGMGGCLLNGCAIAANYALEAYHDVGVRRVAILDVDAHHGNGVAACVEERRGVRYCSIHEEAEDHHHTRRGEALIDDPRGPAEWDVGPLGSLRNVPLPAGTGWDDGYRDALVGTALPFLLESKPDVLLVACGFDALAEDETSGLQLKPEDYSKMGMELKKAFGNRVVFGLEGGYCWENGRTLGDAVVELASAWEED